jgi:hypothetical protein
VDCNFRTTPEPACFLGGILFGRACQRDIFVILDTLDVGLQDSGIHLGLTPAPLLRSRRGELDGSQLGVCPARLAGAFFDVLSDAAEHLAGFLGDGGLFDGAAGELHLLFDEVLTADAGLGLLKDVDGARDALGLV